VYCNRPCLCVCGSVTTTRNCRQLEIACINPHQTGFAGKRSDHLQLIKFWPSRAPGKGICGGAKFFGSALLQPARSVCIASGRCSFSPVTYARIHTDTLVVFIAKGYGCGSQNSGWLLSRRMCTIFTLRAKLRCSVL